MKAHGGMKGYLHAFLTSALDVGEFTLHMPYSSNSLRDLHAFRRVCGGSQQFWSIHNVWLLMILKSALIYALWIQSLLTAELSRCTIDWLLQCEWPWKTFSKKITCFVRLRVLGMSEWDTVLKTVRKVHAVISILNFASGTCCMLQPSTIYPSPPPRRFSTSVLKHDYLKQLCLHCLFLYISGCKDKIRVFCAMREGIFARCGTICFQSGSTPKFANVLG
jgi:hypothetical protein